MTTTDARQGVPRWAAPVILVGVVLVFAAVAAIAVLGTETMVRPEAGTIPLPQGATVRFMDERCPSPEVDQPDGGAIRCDIVLAVGPLDGLWTPGPTYVLLHDHLEREGWNRELGPSGIDTSEVFVDPDRTMSVRAESLARTEERDAQLAHEIRDRMRDFVDPDDLAVVTAYPSD